jgi:hypothetical protein
MSLPLKCPPPPILGPGAATVFQYLSIYYIIIPSLFDLLVSHYLTIISELLLGFCCLSPEKVRYLVPCLIMFCSTPDCG